MVIAETDGFQTHDLLVQIAVQFPELEVIAETDGFQTLDLIVQIAVQLEVFIIFTDAKTLNIL